MYCFGKTPTVIQELDQTKIKYCSIRDSKTSFSHFLYSLRKRLSNLVTNFPLSCLLPRHGTLLGLYYSVPIFMVNIQTNYITYFNQSRPSKLWTALTNLILIPFVFYWWGRSFYFFNRAVTFANTLTSERMLLPSLWF